MIVSMLPNVLAQTSGQGVPPAVVGLGVLAVAVLALFVAFKVGRFIVKVVLILSALLAAAAGVFWLLGRL